MSFHSFIGMAWMTALSPTGRSPGAAGAEVLTKLRVGSDYHFGGGFHVGFNGDGFTDTLITVHTTYCSFGVSSQQSRPRKGPAQETLAADEVIDRVKTYPR